MKLSDATDYHALLSFSEVSEHSDIPHAPTFKRSERFVSWMSKLSTRGHGCAWIIERKQNNELIGAIRINSFEKKIGSALIGYEIHPEHWNNGYASEALNTLVGFAHNSLNLNRIEAWTTTANKASQKVLKNNGFEHEGRQRQKIYFKDQLHDLELFARLKSDKTNAV